MNRLCLCMMVKDEAPVLERALVSAIPWVDRYAILDTGSTDNTREMASKFLAPVGGVLQESEWVDFAHGRTQAFKLAQEQGCDYILMMDADQTVCVTDKNFLAKLKLDGYNIDIHHGPLVYPHPWLLSSRLNWRWEGATHEYITCDTPHTTGECQGIHLIEHADSHRRSSGAKATEDLALLESAHADNPEDARTVFYLAQACADLGKWTCSLRYYKERVRLGGWVEEQWAAQYRLGTVYEHLNMWEMACDSYLRAFNLQSGRAEPLYRLGKGWLMRRNFVVAHMFFERAVSIKFPRGALFVEVGVYRDLARWGLSMCLRLMGKDQEAQYIEDSIMGAKGTPDHIVTEILGSRASKSIGLLP